MKILPRAFTEHADRLARFAREARVLAALNHPNIATIHGVQDDDGIHALVMELVEGDTLAERMLRGHLPVPEALDIAQQVVEALDAAHEKGIVHRDLKPANIKITGRGIVKLLDFGLAKVLNNEAVGQDGTDAPTLAIDGTREGIVVGTAAYMSPEQARGLPVDARTDVWAFACVVYEMLASRSPFAAATVSDTIVGILEHDPDWTALPDGTRPAVRRLLQACLAKDPNARPRGIGQARETLAVARQESARFSAEHRPRLQPRSIAVAVGALALAAASVLLWTARDEPPLGSVQAGAGNTWWTTPST